MFRDAKLAQSSTKVVSKLCQTEAGATLETEDEPCISEWDTFRAFLNFAMVKSFVDVMDRSALALLKIATDMLQDRNLDVSSGDRLFTCYLGLHQTAAENGAAMPSYNDIAMQFTATPTLRKAFGNTENKEKKRGAEDEDKKSKGNKKSRKSSSPRVEFCHVFERDGKCDRSNGVSCTRRGKPFLHGCKKFVNGKQCLGPHKPSECPG